MLHVNPKLPTDPFVPAPRDRTSFLRSPQIIYPGFPDVSAVKKPPANTGDARDKGSIPASGRSPAVGDGNPLQYSCLGNPMDREAWGTVHGVAKSWTWLSTFTHKSYITNCHCGGLKGWGQYHLLDFSGDPVVNTTCSQCRGPRFDPSSSN